MNLKILEIMKYVFTFLAFSFCLLSYGQDYDSFGQVHTGCEIPSGIIQGPQLNDGNNYFRAAAAAQRDNVDMSRNKLSNVAFQNAKISISGSESITYLARFNPYINEIEVKDSKNNIVYLKKVNDLVVDFSGSGNVYQILPYANKSGDVSLAYFSNQNNGNLFQKSDYKYVAAKRSNNSYSSDSPAKYIETTSYYYRNFNQQLIKLDKRKKEIAKNFPTLAKDIETFIKKNKINLKKKENLMELSDYIYALESKKKSMNYDVAILDNK